jgi:hypothetical protein
MITPSWDYAAFNDAVLMAVVPTTILLALTVDTIIAIDFTWRLLAKLMEDTR